MLIYDMIYVYLLNAIGLPPGGSSTVHTHTHTPTIHRTQNKQYVEQHKNFGRVWAVPRLCGFYPGFCPTTEEKARKNLSQGSRRVPAVCYAAYSGNSLPTCGENLSIPLEDGIDRLSRNIGKELPLLDACYPRRAHTSSSSQRKPEITRRSYTCKGGMKATHIDLTLS